MSKFARMRLRLKLWRISGTKLTVGLLLFISGAFLVYKLSGDKDISEGDTAVHPYHLPKHDPILPNELDRRLPNRPPRKFTAEDERKLLEFEAKMVPGLGEHGKAVELTGDEKTLADTIHAKEAFNLIASDKISLTRSVPDNRHKDCAKIEYDSVLPTASVIIIFTNEALSPLLRTIHSVLSKSPAQFLHEIVLVDDASDREELGSLLELYIERRLPSEKIKLHRLPSRHGLIRARLEGARIASGDVLVYLDSHCECGEDWLRPLLQRIKQNRRAVVVPIIEVINDRNMQYYTSTSGRFMVGSFTWSGHFTWINVPEQEKRRLNNDLTAPTRSATMAGGLFAIDRSYFWEVGSYDEGMDIWGGENLEMSFRVWMCGGALETVPCSLVGHIFRDFHPYTFPGKKDTHGINTVRMAEVWMDDYKRLFYLQRQDLKTVDFGSVDSRLELRRKLGCKSFKWYLDNIAPSKFILDEDSVAYGQVKNGPLCLDNLQRESHEKAYTLGIYPCHTVFAMSQFFALSKKGELRREEVCAEVSENHVLMRQCNNQKSQRWDYTESQFRHIQSGKCLDRGASVGESDVQANDCDPMSESQRWNILQPRDQGLKAS